MGVRFPGGGAAAFVTQVLVTTAETVVLTTPPLIQMFDAAIAVIMFYAIVTLGATTTAITPRIRLGTAITGALQSGGNPITGAAGNNVLVSGFITTLVGTSAGAQYSLTLQQTAATTNGNVLEGSLYAMVL